MNEGSWQVGGNQVEVVVRQVNGLQAPGERKSVKRHILNPETLNDGEMTEELEWEEAVRGEAG